MTDTNVVDTTVEDGSAPVVATTPTSVELINSQKANFVAQLEQVRKDMAQCQQTFETLKIRGTKLEGAIESLDILLKSLPK